MGILNRNVSHNVMYPVTHGWLHNKSLPLHYDVEGVRPSKTCTATFRTMSCIP